MPPDDKYKCDTYVFTSNTTLQLLHPRRKNETYTTLVPLLSAVTSALRAAVVIPQTRIMAERARR
jgi:hypothetical protein